MTIMSKRMFAQWWKISHKFKTIYMPAIKTYTLPGICTISCGACLVYFTYKYGKLEGNKNVPKVHVLVQTTKMKEEQNIAHLTAREKRFVRFASVRYGDTIYMTPQDFLESVVEAEPRPRLHRKVLSDDELKIIRNRTPNLAIHGSCSDLFTNLNDVGILCYSEYVFLLSVLTKSEYAFSVAFELFDFDSNGTINKTKFLEMEKILGMGFNNTAMYIRKDKIDTTLLLHFFGHKSNYTLNFERFRKFMFAIQTEALRTEFYKFSKGFPTMSAMDFASILMRYSYISLEDYEDYMKRVSNKSGQITLVDFITFFSFLNDLEDFNIAMRMFTRANYCISKHQFIRGVKICTGHDIGSPVVDALFAIFGTDDILTNYENFVQVMTDRRYRGFKLYKKNDGWKAFIKCLRRELQ